MKLPPVLPDRIAGPRWRVACDGSRLSGDKSGLCAGEALRRGTKMTADHTLSIRVNGQHRRVAGGTTIAELATELGLLPEKVAVERNLEIVPRSTLAQVAVQDGDDFEIVTFVGGG
jgi:thiamine biosynthesis protein ThiS